MTSPGTPHAVSSPPDEAARVRIRTDLATTLFVEAGAGAGKTSSLVARIVSLVRSGVPITGIAAITFTEKAAAELRSRTRASLEHDPSPEAQAALDRLDHAPIGTLHSFARRMLFDFPIEAGLPPGFSVLDELESASRVRGAVGRPARPSARRTRSARRHDRRRPSVRRTLRIRRLRHQQGRPPDGQRLPGQLGSRGRPRRPHRSWATAPRHRSPARARHRDRRHTGTARRHGRSRPPATSPYSSTT